MLYVPIPFLKNTRHCGRVLQIAWPTFLRRLASESRSERWSGESSSTTTAATLALAFRTPISLLNCYDNTGRRFLRYWLIYLGFLNYILWFLDHSSTTESRRQKSFRHNQRSARSFLMQILFWAIWEFAVFGKAHISNWLSFRSIFGDNP